MKKLFAVPLILFFGTVVFLYSGLFSDPTKKDSQVLDRPFPAFDLPDLADPSIRYSNDLFEGQVTLVNVWGVWCTTCAYELPFLTQLRGSGVRVVGLYYDQDLDPSSGTKTLERVNREVIQMTNRYGNPYLFNIFDVYRDTSLDLGITGAPETFLVDASGHIRVHHLGLLDQATWDSDFAPVYTKLVAEVNQSTTSWVDPGFAERQLALLPRDDNKGTGH